MGYITILYAAAAAAETAPLHSTPLLSLSNQIELPSGAPLCCVVLCKSTSQPAKGESLTAGDLKSGFPKKKDKSTRRREKKLVFPRGWGVPAHQLNSVLIKSLVLIKKTNLPLNELGKGCVRELESRAIYHTSSAVVFEEEMTFEDF